MADSGAIRAGRAFIEVGLDGVSKMAAGLQSALNRVKAFGASVQAIGNSLSSFGGKLSGLGGITQALGEIAPGLANFTFSPAGILTGLLGMAKGFANAGSELNDMAQRTGFAVEDLSALKFAAEQAGASLEDMETGIKFMQKGGFGHTIEDFVRIADSIKAIEDPMARTQKATEIFGRGGTKLLSPIMEGLRKVMDEAKAAGLVMSSADAAAADKFGDALDKLWATLKMTTAVIGSALAPILTDLVAQVMPLVSDFAKWVRENKELVVVLLKVAAAGVAIGIGLGLLGGLISTIGGAISSVATMFLSFVGAVKFAVAVLSFLVSPLGLIIGMWVAFAAWALHWSDAFKTLFTGLKDTSIATWKGIVGALSSGDLALAGKIAMAGLKVAWNQGLDAMRGSFFGWIGDVKAGFLNLLFKLGALSQKDFMVGFRELQEQADRAKAPSKETLDAQRELATLINTVPARKPPANILENVMDKARQGETGTGVGTFSAAGALVMGGRAGDIGQRLDQQLAQQKSAVELLKQILEQQQRRQGLRFG